jgi:hypothetical protein
MMNKKQFNYILEKGKWKLTFFEYLNRYFIIVVPIAFIILGTHLLFDKSIISRISLSDFISLFPFWFLGLGVLLFIYSCHRIESERKFRRIEIQKEIETFELSSFLKELNWSVQEVKSNIVVAETDWSAFSWGEEITIILCEGYLLINSRTTGSQPFTLGRDIYNYKKLKELLELKLLT